GGVEQKVKASIARRESPSAVRSNAIVADDAQLRIHLRGRTGLERFVSEEVGGKFRLLDVQPGKVTIVPVAPFSIADIYAMRCFGTVGFVLGAVETASAETLARVITSELSKRLLRAFTE